MRVPLLLAFATLASAGAAAQAPGALPAEATEPLHGRHSQRVERIVHEDDASRIDEVRVGGQTQRITVQPKSGLPAYQVEAAPLSRSRPADARDGLGAAGGRRSWNVFSF